MSLEKQKMLDLIFGWIYRHLMLTPIITNGSEVSKKDYL